MSLTVKSITDYTRTINNYKELEKNECGLKPLLTKYCTDKDKQKVIHYIDPHINFPCFQEQLQNECYQRLNLLALFKFFYNKGGFCRFIYKELSDFLGLKSRLSTKYHIQKLLKSKIIFINRWQGFRMRITHYVTPWGINEYILKYVLYENTGNLRRHPPVTRLEQIRQYMIWCSLRKHHKIAKNRSDYFDKVTWLNEHLLRHIKEKS